MALKAVQQNTLTNIQIVAQALHNLKPSIDTVVQQYFNEIDPAIQADSVGFNADLLVIESLEHLTATEIINAVAALQALQTWGGDLTTGNYGGLLKMLQSGL